MGSEEVLDVLLYPYRSGRQPNAVAFVPAVDWAGQFEKAMNPTLSLSYRIVTGFPIRYSIIPFSIRKHFLRLGTRKITLAQHVSGEVSRKALLEHLAVTGLHLKRNVPPRFLITHDIDTDKGPEAALLIKAVEDKLNLRSTFFFVSEQYSVPKRVAKDLADSSVIGSHDIKHDGRLVTIRRFDHLVQRLRRSRLSLEEIFEKDVNCFRAPLLQFSRRIVSALGRAGYVSDFSASCWEPAYPLTSSGSGVELAQEFEIDGVIEFPLTLYQDSFLLEVLQMSFREALEFWIEQAKLVKSFEGNIILSVHPELFYHNLGLYEELLRCLLEIHNADRY